MVNEDRMRHTFEDLVKIDAPSKGEREVCDYLKKKLRALGAAKITEDNNGSVNGGNSGNLIAVFNANTEGLPSIALTAHMDCVENCRGIEPVLEDGVYRSKGDTVLGGDDKAGVAAILEGLALMKETYIPHGKVTVIFTVQEEIGLCGSSSIEEKYILRHRFRLYARRRRSCRLCLYCRTVGIHPRLHLQGHRCPCRHGA